MTLEQTQQWFKQAVLGLNLCPFAHKPEREGTIRWIENTSNNEQQLLDSIIQECAFLEKPNNAHWETSLIVISQALEDFYDYQFFLEEANYQLKQHQWQGVFQLASFHPYYCFASSEYDDPANFTNRSPYPIIHILREQRLSEALEKVENPEEIPNNNIKKLRALSKQEINQLFKVKPE